MSTMKRKLVSVAAAFAVASTSALAQGVKMSDQQLDQVTAAGAQSLSLVVISNPGNASVGRNLDLQGGPHGTCINCAALPSASNEGRTNGVVVLQNRKFTVESPIIRCVGAGLLGLC